MVRISNLLPSISNQPVKNRIYCNDVSNYITKTNANSQKIRIEYTPFGQVSQVCLAVAEQTDGGSVKRYLQGINLLAGEADGMVYYYILNEHGDVSQLWGQSGTCKASYEYDAFGNERNPEKGEEHPFRYCGEYFDSSSGNYYLRNRYYSPGTGRFRSEDPAQAGLNWYTYANNNPIRFTDSTGLDPALDEYVNTNYSGQVTITFVVQQPISGSRQAIDSNWR